MNLMIVHVPVVAELSACLLLQTHGDTVPALRHLGVIGTETKRGFSRFVRHHAHGTVFSDLVILHERGHGHMSSSVKIAQRGQGR